MLKDYHSQFDTLNSTVDSNNTELDKLRDEISTAQSSYNELRVQQCGLESEVDILRSRHQLSLGLNENLRLSQLKLSIQDQERRSRLLQSDLEQIVTRWQGKIAFVRKSIEDEHLKSH
jgi:flagellar biosynthesis chaperone FliJ